MALTLRLSEQLVLTCRMSSTKNPYMRFEKDASRGRTLKFPLFQSEWDALVEHIPSVTECVSSPTFAEVGNLEYEISHGRYLSVEQDSILNDGGPTFVLRDNAFADINISAEEWQNFVRNLDRARDMMRVMDGKGKRKGQAEDGEDEETPAKKKRKDHVYRYGIRNSAKKGAVMIVRSAEFFQRKEACLTAGNIYLKTLHDPNAKLEIIKYTLYRRDPLEFIRILYHRMKIGRGGDPPPPLLSKTFTYLFNDVLGWGPNYLGDILSESACLFLKGADEQSDTIKGDEIHPFLMDWNDEMEKSTETPPLGNLREAVEG